MDDKSLDAGGRLIRWVSTPRCVDCDFRDRKEDRCRLPRCRWKDKRPDQYSERLRVTQPDNGGR